MKMERIEDSGVVIAIRPIDDVSMLEQPVDGKSVVDEALAEILTVPGDESLEVSVKGIGYSTVGRSVSSKRLPSRLATTSTLTTAGTTSSIEPEDDNKSMSPNDQSVEMICSYQSSSVLVKSHKSSDISSIRTNTTETRSVSSKEHSTLLSNTDVSDDAQGSVELNLSGQPVTSSTTSSSYGEDTVQDENVEMDSSGIVTCQTNRQYFIHHHERHPSLDISSLACATSMNDPLEQSSNNLPTSRVTNVTISNAAKTKRNEITQETKTRNNDEHWSNEINLQAIVFNRTSSSLTSKGTRIKMENKIASKTMNKISKIQSFGNEDDLSHEVDLEDLIVVRTTGASHGTTPAAQQANVASKSRSEDASRQLSSHEVELVDLLQVTTAPTRITSNMTSEQQPKASLHTPSNCLLPSTRSKSYRHEQFAIELGGNNGRSENSSDDTLLLTEDEREISLVRSTTAPENYTLLQIVEVPQVPFMGHEQHSSERGGRGGVDDTEKLLIRKASTHETDFDEDSNCPFRIMYSDFKDCIWLSNGWNRHYKTRANGNINNNGRRVIVA